MKFRVSILRRAEREVGHILRYISEQSQPGAEAWARAFDKALSRLEGNADSFPVAAENEFVDFTVREVLFKTRRGLIYRVLFTIRNEDVLVLHVRSPGQDFADLNDFDESN